MKFGLTDDQASVMTEVERLVAGLSLAPHTEPVVAPYSDVLDRALADSGFLDIAREDGFGPLEAALVTESLARQPHIVEAAASAIVAPALSIPSGAAPHCAAGRRWNQALAVSDQGQVASSRSRKPRAHD